MLDVNGLSFGAAERGTPLPAGLRQRMELLFGTSFADVRVHFGDLPDRVGALALAHGSDLYVHPYLYDPSSAIGWELIGHELAHVRQSMWGWELAPEGVGVRLLCDPTLEAEADRMGELARRAFQEVPPVPAMVWRARGPRRWDVVQALRARR